MTIQQFAENAWSMCSAVFALWVAAMCLLLALATMKMTFNLIMHWAKKKKEAK